MNFIDALQLGTGLVPVLTTVGASALLAPFVPPAWRRKPVFKQTMVLLDLLAGNWLHAKNKGS